MSLHPKDFFHSGLIVENLEATCQELSRTQGVTWSPLLVTEVPIWRLKTGGIEMLPVRAIFTVEFPHLEVLQAMPGTRTETMPGKPLDHLGYWSDDLLAESEALEKQGIRRISCGMLEGQIFGHCYHQTSDGLVQELVDRSLIPNWEAWLHGEASFTDDKALLRYLGT